MTEFKEMLIQLGTLRVAEPSIDWAYMVALEERWRLQLDDSPHGRPWHTSFHASSFPGDDPQACGRFAMYGLMDIPKGGPTDRWLHGTAEAGKSIELSIVRAVRDAGLLVQSGQEGRSTDPEARDEHGEPMPQIGFEDPDHWLTGSVDMPWMPHGHNTPLITEIKTKHEDKIREMALGQRQYDAKHRRQLLCSLGLAHEHPEAFLHPVTGKPLPAAQDGVLYYHPRDTPWPGPIETFEFYFQYDPGFMEEGRAKLAEWKMSFLDDELPQKVAHKNRLSHPNGPGWRWSEGACKYCNLKKICRSDYEDGTTSLSESAAVAVATFQRPGYSHRAKRSAVLRSWGIDDEG